MLPRVRRRARGPGSPTEGQEKGSRDSSLATDFLSSLWPWVSAKGPRDCSECSYTLEGLSSGFIKRDPGEHDVLCYEEEEALAGKLCQSGLSTKTETVELLHLPVSVSVSLMVCLSPYMSSYPLIYRAIYFNALFPTIVGAQKSKTSGGGHWAGNSHGVPCGHTKEDEA